MFDDQDDEEMMFDFSLDSNGRTKYERPQNNNKNNETSYYADSKSKEESTTFEINYTPHTVWTNLKKATTKMEMNERGKQLKLDTLIDDLLYDAEICDCALMPRTFWIPCKGMKPRCRMEELALEIFYHHVDDSNSESEASDYDLNKSGAEWWVQIRPSPKAGRYNLLSNNNKDDNNDDESQKGICFHWDKDEELRLLMDGNMYIHPHLSTVTYLTEGDTSHHVPTIAFNYCVDALTGKYLPPLDENNTSDDQDSKQQAQEAQAYLSWPRRGKHLSFDGRFLHAAPSDLVSNRNSTATVTATDKQKQESSNNNEDSIKNEKILERRTWRVTFLVNIWLNYKPFNVKPFPSSMIDKLTKSDNENDKGDNNNKGILFVDKKENENTKTTEQYCKCVEWSSSTLLKNENVHENENNKNSDETDDQHKYRHFKWSMGSNNNEKEQEFFEIQKLPLSLIHSQEKCSTNNDGNVHLLWSSSSNSYYAPQYVTERNNKIASTKNNNDGEKEIRYSISNDSKKPKLK